MRTKLMKKELQDSLLQFTNGAFMPKFEMQVINCGSNTSYYCSQCYILISWNSRLIANLIFSVFDYYNLAIKHTVYNSVIWSGADVLMLVYFLFCISEWMKIHLLFLNIGHLCFGFLWKNCGKNCLLVRTCCCSFFKQIVL